MIDADVRALTVDDVDQIVDVGHDAIGRLYADPDKGHQPLTEDQWTEGRAIARHVLATDPDGAWGIDDPEQPGRLLGAAVAIRRDGLWFLQKLAVRPETQTKGLGARLLGKAHANADGATARMLCASKDPRALRRYWHSGFTLEPAFYSHGTVDRTLLPADRGVSVGDLDRVADLVAELDVQQRGASRLVDVEAVTAMGFALLVARGPAGRGYVVAKAGEVWGLAATDEATARRLLWAGLALTPEGRSAGAHWLTARTPWAVDVVLQARLGLGFVGCVAIDGGIGPLDHTLVNGFFG